MFARLSSRLFGGKKATPRDPETLEEACAYLEGESEEQLRALSYISGRVIRKGLPSSTCLSLVLNCLDSDFGRVREDAFRVFHSIYKVRDIHFVSVRRSIGKELTLADHVGAVRASLSLLNSLDVSYKVQFLCSETGSKSIRDGMIAADPDIRGEIFLGVGRLLPVVWWYIDCSADDVDGLFYRSMSVFDGEFKCDWSAEECARVYEDVSELCKQFYWRCAQGLIGEATTTDTMGNVVDLPDSSTAFNGCCWALVHMIQISNLRGRGLSVEARLEGLVGTLDTSYGDGTVLPTSADPLNWPGSISTYSGVRHSLMCHALSSSVSPFVQTAIHTCLAYMRAIVDRGRAEQPSGGLLLAAQVLRAVLLEVDGDEPLSSVRVLAKIKEKFRFGDEEEAGVRPKAEASPTLLPLLEFWSKAAVEALQTPSQHPQHTQYKRLIATELVQVLLGSRLVGTGTGTGQESSLMSTVGPPLLRWLLESGVGDEERLLRVALAATLMETRSQQSAPGISSSSIPSSSSPLWHTDASQGALEAAVSLCMDSPSLGTARVLASSVCAALSLCPTRLCGAVEKTAESTLTDAADGAGLKVVVVVLLRATLHHLHQSMTADVPAGDCQVAGACSRVVEALRVLLSLLGGRHAAITSMGPQSDQNFQACLLAWAGAASALSALLFPSSLAPGTACTTFPSFARDASSAGGGALSRLRKDLDGVLRGAVQAFRPHRNAPTDASCMLLRLLCRHSLAIARHSTTPAASPKGTEEAMVESVKQSWALLAVWLERALSGPSGDAPTLEVSQSPFARPEAEQDEGHFPLRRFGSTIRGAGAEAESNAIDKFQGVVFQGVVPSPHQLDAPSCALELCLNAYFHAAAARKALPGSGFPRAVAPLIEQIQSLLRAHSLVYSEDKGEVRRTHAMLVEECSRASKLIRAATGITSKAEAEAEAEKGEGEGEEREIKARDIDCLSPSFSLQLRGSLSGHWATRGAKDGWMASPVFEPTASTASAAAATGGGGIGAAALTETVRRLAVQKTTPVAAVTRALHPSGWIDYGEARLRRSKRCADSFLPAAELIAAADDVICWQGGLGATSAPRDAGAGSLGGTGVEQEQEQEQEQAWDGLDELPESPFSRVLSQLSASGDLLTVLGSSCYDHQSGGAVFHVRVCNSGGFTVPSVQLRARQQLPGPSSLSDEPPIPRPPLSPEDQAPPASLSGQELLSPIFSYLAAGAVADHVFRVPTGPAIGPVRLSVSLQFSELIEEGNGEARSLLPEPTNPFFPPPQRSTFGPHSGMALAPLSLPPVAMLRPYGLGLWSHFSRAAWRHRETLWRHPKETMLRQLPSAVLRSPSESLGGVPAYVFQQLWQVAATSTSLPPIVPLKCPIAAYGEEVVFEDAPVLSSTSTSASASACDHLAVFIEQAIALADAGAGGAALPGSMSISTAARVLLPPPSTPDGAGVCKRQLAWALQAPSSAFVCVLVTIWTSQKSSGPLDGTGTVADGCLGVFAEAEVRSSGAPELASLTTHTEALDSLLLALSGDTLSVDVQARERIEASDEGEGEGEGTAWGLGLRAQRQRQRLSADWALAEALSQ